MALGLLAFTVLPDKMRERENVFFKVAGEKESKRESVRMRHKERHKEREKNQRGVGTKQRGSNVYLRLPVATQNRCSTRSNNMSPQRWREASRNCLFGFASTT